ncbi:hypothetical protein GCM10009416_01680 [Craurococcus roseus]|uniref:Uncharacterized protein n=1 Tax=Craurococcus roseus TaxID=77585 RepID=A0ABP3PHM5_9PROT
MPTIFLIALRLGGAVADSLVWYWSLPQLARQAADARTRDHIERTYSASIWALTPAQAREVHAWAKAQHA